MRTASAWGLVLVASIVACGGKVLSDGSIATSSADAGGSSGADPGSSGDPGGPGAPPSSLVPDASMPPLACGNGEPGQGVNPSGASCTVSFTRDLLGKKMGAAGAWGCATSGCHDPQGGTPPKIDVTDPVYTYRNLYNSGTGETPYINPCSYSEDDSEIVGNLSNPSYKGDHMPKGQTNVPSALDLELVKSWVACGSPLN